MAATALAFCSWSALAQQDTGPFTAEQAAQGHADYSTACAACHQENLSGGGEAPSVAGGNFVKSWGGRSTRELYDYLRSTMPLGKGGSLSDQTYQNILAFLLEANGATAGGKPFTAETDVKIGNVANGQMPGGLARRGEPTQLARSGLTVAGQVPHYTPVTDAMLNHPAEDDWLMFRRNYQGWSFSPLKQIDAGNVRNLQLKWAWAMNEGGANEVTPIVHEGIIFLSNTDNIVQALDGRTGDLIWENRMRPPGLGGGTGAMRNLAIYQDKVFAATTDAHLIAVDARTGKAVWDVQVGDNAKGYGSSSGPIVIHGKVIQGENGCDRYKAQDKDQGCFISAFDPADGKLLWRFNTIARAGEPGGDTWGDLPNMLRVGAETWITGSYDPELNLTYWGIGNPGPDYNADQRPGDNLYTDSVVALDADTGRLKWHYQFTPHDLHDWDAVAPLLAIDAPFKGKPRQLMLQANRNGFFYVLDRSTGEFLLGVPFVKKMDWADGIDEKGRPRVRASATPTPAGVKACPNVVGATNWYSSAYNPATGLFYVMALESCGIYTKSDAWWEQGKSFYGGGTRRVPGETPERFLRALDIQTGKTVWEIPQIGGGGGWGGVLSTAGGLVFFCDESGALAAADAKSGQLLWHFHTNQQWHASPMTYAVDGRQYVAVAAGSNIISFALQ